MYWIIKIDIVVILPFSFPIPYPFPISSYPSSIHGILPLPVDKSQTPGRATAIQQNSLNPRPSFPGSLKIEICYWQIPVNHLTAPFFSVILLLCTKCINGTVVRQGIVGSNGIKPLDIMALFISLVGCRPYLESSIILRGMLIWWPWIGIYVNIIRHAWSLPISCVLGSSKRRLLL